MSQVKEVSGKLSRITDVKSREIQGSQGAFTSYSIGIQIEGNPEWFNIQAGSEEKAREVLNRIDGGVFKLGDNVKIYLESKDGRYWKVTSITSTDEQFIDAQKIEEKVGPSPVDDRTQSIIKQVCLKISSEQVKGTPEQLVEYAKKLYHCFEKWE